MNHSQVSSALLLVTAFEPFGDWSENSGLWVLEALARGPLPEVAMRTLPVEYDRAGAMALAAMAETGARQTIMLGMASRTRVIRIERTARNRDGCPRPDNAGVLRLTEHPIVRGDGETLSPAFPREDLLAWLAAAGLPVEMSDNAGSYVCNNAYYHVARGVALDPPERRREVVFVHVPGPDFWTRDHAAELAEALRGWVVKLSQVVA